MVALSLMGSAILLFSCGGNEADSEGVNNETLMTERSEHLTILMSENGRRSYYFKTPLLEGYTLAADPYREFRKGIHIITYQNDSLTTVNATLVANYAIYYEKRELWEAKGDVVVEKADGTKLYTQQLFWNSKTGRIYSNVDSKIVKGSDVFMGEGFESDEELKEWRFRRMSGKMLVNMEPTEKPDSSATSKTKSSSVKSKNAKGGTKPESTKNRAKPESVKATSKSSSSSAKRPSTQQFEKRENLSNRGALRSNSKPTMRKSLDGGERLQIRKAEAPIRAEDKLD